MDTKTKPEYALRTAIRDTLQARGLTVGWLARQAKVDPANLYMYLKCRRDMVGLHVDACRKALGLGIIDLMPQE